jgi:hypothetical protein
MKWVILGAFLICVGALVFYAIRQGQKNCQKLEAGFRKPEHPDAYRVYLLALRQGATEDEAWEAARAYEQHH